MLPAETQAGAGAPAPFAVGIERQVTLPHPAGLGELAQLEVQLRQIVHWISVVRIRGDGPLEADPRAVRVAGRLLQEREVVPGIGELRVDVQRQLEEQLGLRALALARAARWRG